MTFSDHLRLIRKERLNRRRERYKNILDALKQRMEEYTARDKTSCWYVVPVYKIGEPLYNLTEAVEFCRKKLIREGFKVQVEPPNRLFIDWKAH